MPATVGPPALQLARPARACGALASTTSAACPLPAAALGLAHMRSTSTHARALAEAGAWSALPPGGGGQLCGQTAALPGVASAALVGRGCSSPLSGAERLPSSWPRAACCHLRAAPDSPTSAVRSALCSSASHMQSALPDKAANHGWSSCAPCWAGRASPGTGCELELVQNAPGAERVLQTLAHEALHQLARAAALAEVWICHHRGRQGRRRGQAQVARPDGPTGRAGGERAVDVGAKGRIAVQEAALHMPRARYALLSQHRRASTGANGAAPTHTAG